METVGVIVAALFVLVPLGVMMKRALGNAGVAPPIPDDVGAPPEEAERTSSGLASVVLKPASAEDTVTELDTVTVHYTGWTTDGELFDSSELRGRPATFPLRAVIPGWKEGVCLMKPGERRRMWIPSHLAYGDDPGPGMPSGMLVFEVELLAIH